MNKETLLTTCCIAGGGPAGMMLGLLLARTGIDVIVLEKHADFLRDFRGDTIHPSTLQVMHELGFLDELLNRPHQKVYRLKGYAGDSEVTIADFSKLGVQAPYIAFMPQWDFLNFIAEKAANFPNFKLIMQAEVTALITTGAQVTGAIAKTPGGEIHIHSTLLIGADGRESNVRGLAGLQVHEYGAPMDALWFRLSRLAGDPTDTFGRFLPGNIMIMINRGEYWQCGYVIPKGRFETLKQLGLAAFLESLGRNAPLLKDRVHELKEWDQIKLLTVKVDRLERWYRHGLLCIGDAAHAMSPVGGVGINLAIQDAVATANLLADPLRSGALLTQHLALVQKRRIWPTRMTQRMQLFLHKRLIQKILREDKPFHPPLPLRLLNRFPMLRRVTGYIIGIGFRPEHIEALKPP